MENWKLIDVVKFLMVCWFVVAVVGIAISTATEGFWSLICVVVAALLSGAAIYAVCRME